MDNNEKEIQRALGLEHTYDVIIPTIDANSGKHWRLRAVTVKALSEEEAIQLGSDLIHLDRLPNEQPEYHKARAINIPGGIHPWAITFNKVR